MTRAKTRAMFDPRDLIAALDAARIAYVVIGGFAVAAHGYVRATKDLDIVPSPAPDNLERLAGLLRDLDAQLYGTGDFDAAEFPFDPLDPKQLAGGGNFLLQTRLGRLDMMQWVPGIEAESAYEHLSASATSITVWGHPVWVCSMDDLVIMKRTAGRRQDLDDLSHLGGG